MFQGTSAAVTYDLSIQSSVFGTIDDPGRIMRFVQGTSGWQVAWSTMDIFDGLTSSSQLRLTGIPEPRANIYDRNGLPLVEQNGTVVSLFVQRQSIPDEAACLDLLADVLRRQRQDLFDFFERYDREIVFYVGEVNLEVFDLRFPLLNERCAIRTLERQTRKYYHGNAVSHVVGYIGQIPEDQLATWQQRGYQGGELVGRNGIELAYEDELAGQPTRRLQIVESGGTVTRELGETAGTPPAPVTLTVDRELQAEVAQALADAFNFAEGNWGSRSISTGAAAVVLDTHTGAILAMSSYPLFEPDVFNPDTQCCTLIAAGERIADMVADTRTPLLNRVTQQQYSPGSVYKIVTTAAAASEEIVAPDEIFDCTLTWNGAPFGDDVGFERVDWRLTDGLEATGPVTISQALTSSCDPFFYEMGAKLYSAGPSVLVDYARRLGLGEPFGINYFGPEAPGQLPVPRGTSDAINSAIGQGDIKVSPLQMAVVTMAVANGGTVYRPYLVQRVGGADNTEIIFEAQPEVMHEAELSAEVLEIVREGMCAVTTDAELGTAAFPFENTPYVACGKTGTAQTSSYPDAWFVAYAPREDPQIAVAVIGERSREGADVAAPIVRRIMDFYLRDRYPDYQWPGYPRWWNENEYIPLQIPVGATGG
jgi:penicillin-binding protein 2